MGIGPFSSCSMELDDTPNSQAPNPKSFKILKTKQVGLNLVVKINYPNCTNFEGNKILVYKNLSQMFIYSMKIIDPHFNNKGTSPFVRFEPTDDGWQAAIDFAKHIS